MFDRLPIGVQDFVSHIKRPIVKPVVALASIFAIVGGGAYFEQSRSPEKVVRDAFTKFSMTNDPANYNSITQDSAEFTYEKLSAIAAKHHFKKCNEWKIPEAKDEPFPADDLARKYPNDKFVVVLRSNEEGDGAREKWEYLYATNCHPQGPDFGPL